MRGIIRWIPAFLLMTTIFIFSSIPSQEMPSFGLWDTMIKKGGHALGYGILTLSYTLGLRWDPKRYWVAYLFTILFALSDELHQSFVPGRHASLIDALGFDAGGALMMLGGTWCGRNVKN
jgi:VanZ family protein